MSRPLESSGGDQIFSIRTIHGEDNSEKFSLYYQCAPDSETYNNVSNRAKEFGLNFTQQELRLISLLNTPEELNIFIETQLAYNFDHTTIDTVETAKSPKGVLNTGTAQCFEAAMFAYTVHFLHGRNPQMCLLEAVEDAQHNLVIYEDPKTGLIGSTAHSSYMGLSGRPAIYNNLKDLASSYLPYYYDGDKNNITLVGYSEPFSLDRYGCDWMSSDDELWDIYHTYINVSNTFHYLEDDRPHHYSLVEGLLQGWIKVKDGEPFIDTEALPPEARTHYDLFWKDEKNIVAKKEFFRLTGTTPYDLRSDSQDLVKYLKAGHRLEGILEN